MGFPGHARANYQGLWWKSPAGSESGWGLNLTHQGDVLFGTWFTYAADGTGMWLVMPEGRRVGAQVYSGALYRTTGPAFSAAPWNPAAVVAIPAGEATLVFASANSARFLYTVDGVSQEKDITRQVYASLPVCAFAATPSSSNYQDLWWAAPAGSESGWGVNLAHQDDIVFATWFTYDTAGKQMWLVMPEGRRTAANVYSGPLYRTMGPSFSTFSPASPPVAATLAGTATFTFTGASTGTFAFMVNGVSRTKSIARQTYASPSTSCRPG